METSPGNGKKRGGLLLRWTLQAIGCSCLALAVLGLFLPVLPTVPFLLLALACFSRSSDRFYTWLLRHEQLGPIIQPYLNGQGMPFKSKLKAIALVWASIIISAVFLVNLLWVRIMLPIVALGVTFYLLRLPTAEEIAPFE